MKVEIWVSADGLETLAKGEPLHKWHLSVTIPGSQQSYDHTASDSFLKIGRGECMLPGAAEIQTRAVAALQAELQTMLANHEQVQKDLRDRISDLLMIGYSKTEVVEEISDVGPF